VRLVEDGREGPCLWVSCPGISNDLLLLQHAVGFMRHALRLAALLSGPLKMLWGMVNDADRLLQGLDEGYVAHNLRPQDSVKGSGLIMTILAKDQLPPTVFAKARQWSSLAQVPALWLQLSSPSRVTHVPFVLCGQESSTHPGWWSAWQQQQDKWGKRGSERL
jgi:hypothetical protein